MKLTDTEIEEIARPFTKYIGDYWSSELAIPEGYIEDFARAIERATQDRVSDRIKELEQLLIDIDRKMISGEGIDFFQSYWHELINRVLGKEEEKQGV